MILVYRWSTRVKYALACVKARGMLCKTVITQEAIQMLALSCLFNDTVVLCMKARGRLRSTGSGGDVLGTQSVELGTQGTFLDTPSTLLDTQGTLLGTPSTLRDTQSTLLCTPSTLLGTPSTLLGTPSTLLGTPDNVIGTKHCPRHGSWHAHGIPSVFQGGRVFSGLIHVRH